jgi:hypothetical protein
MKLEMNYKCVSIERQNLEEQICLDPVYRKTGTRIKYIKYAVHPDEVFIRRSPELTLEGSTISIAEWNGSKAAAVGNDD